VHRLHPVVPVVDKSVDKVVYSRAGGGGCRTRAGGEREVPAVGSAVGPFDVGGDDVRVGRGDEPEFLQRVQGVADGAFGQPCVPDEGGDGGEGIASVGVGVVGQTDQDDGEAGGVASVGRDGGGVQGPVNGFDAHW
jgi:hypothetical protein